jgi:hypothetical protein
MAQGLSSILAFYHSRRQRHDLNCFISEATMLSNSGKKLEIHRSVFFLDVFQNVKLLHYNPFEMTFCIFEDLGGSKSLASFEDALGAQAPLGFFDPLGIVTDGDQEKFDRLRYVEIKHGRISMLAVVGYLVAEAGIRLPGDIDYTGLSFADVPNGFAAFNTISGAGIAQIVALIGFLELAVMKDIVGGEFVGDFRNDAFDLGWDTFDEETKLSKRAIELNQGRAAQMGILALMVHEQLGVSLIPSLP